MSKMKNTWNKIKSIFHIAEETISEYKERVIETIQNKKWEKRKEDRWTWGQIQGT